MYKLSKTVLFYNSSISRFIHSSLNLLSKNYYEILGVSKTADSKEIKTKYYELAKKYHPDVNKNNNESAKLFQEVSEAYEILGDVEKRKQYDNFGSSFTNQQYSSNSPGSNTYSQGFHSNMDPEELFRKIFREFSEGMSNGQGFDFNANDFASSFYGSNPTNEMMIDLTLEEAVKGVAKNIEINCIARCPKCRGKKVEPGTGLTICSECNGMGVRTTNTGPFILQQTCSRCRGSGRIVRNPCSECEGTGKTIRKRKIPVTFPPGIDHGQTIRKVLEDDYSSRQEIYFTVRLINSSKFARKGDDVYSDLEIPLALAAIGGKIEVDGLYEKLKIQIPPGTNSHDSIRIPDKGIKKMNRYSYGSHIFNIKLITTKHLTDFQRALLEVLSESEGRANYEIMSSSSTEVEHIKNLLKNFHSSDFRQNNKRNSESDEYKSNPNTLFDPLTLQDVIKYFKYGWEKIKRHFFR